MFCASQQPAPLRSPELYIQGVPPVWTAWVLLLWWPGYHGDLVGVAGPWSSWSQNSASCTGCCPLVVRVRSHSCCGGARSWGNWVRRLSHLRAGTGVLVVSARVQRVPRTGACPQASGLSAWTRASPLLGRLGSWDLWLRGLWVLDLVPAYNWWASEALGGTGLMAAQSCMKPGVGASGCGTLGFDALVGESGVHGLLGWGSPSAAWAGLRLLPGHRSVGQVTGSLVDKAWLRGAAGSGLMRAQACWCMGLWLCLASCLALGVPVTGMDGLVGTAESWYLCWRENFKMEPASTSVHMVEQASKTDPRCTPVTSCLSERLCNISKWGFPSHL